jgi:tripartite-type tricarboxylate transporter receptor subunit TctC
MKRLLSLACALTALALPAVASAQGADGYPSRPIRLITDSPPGGINDIWARRYAQRVGEAIGQPLVVDNRPGASGTIAAEALAKAPADGYTMYYGGMNPLVAYPGAGGVIRFDPDRDFVPVALGTMGYPLLVVGSGLGPKTLKELIAHAKARPNDELTCGTGGHASVQHFACAQFARSVGVKVRAVPYKGGALAALDAANGQIAIASGFSSELEPLTTPGRLVAVGLFGPNRLPKFPDAPTMAEAGFPGIELPSFSGFFVPAGTPAPIVAKLNVELVRAMQRPEMSEWLRTAGGVWMPMKSDEFSSFYRREREKWKRMSEETGIRVEAQ